MNEISHKLVILGETSVGKTSVVLRFVRGEFYCNQESTIGAAFLTQHISLGDGDQIKFEIWDTAGQERYRSLAPMYYRGASVVIIVYDITCRQSFQKAKSWVKELTSSSENAVIALVGNKVDLQERRDISPEEAMNYAENENLLYFETSARTGQNVNELFLSLARAMTKRPTNVAPHKNDSLTLTQDKGSISYSKSCGCV